MIQRQCRVERKVLTKFKSIKTELSSQFLSILGKKERSIQVYLQSPCFYLSSNYKDTKVFFQINSTENGDCYWLLLIFSSSSSSVCNHWGVLGEVNLVFDCSCVQVPVWQEHGVHSAQHLHLQGGIHRIQLSHRWGKTKKTKTNSVWVSSGLKEEMRNLADADTAHYRWSQPWKIWLIDFSIRFHFFFPAKPCVDPTAGIAASVWGPTCANVLPATAGQPARKVSNMSTHTHTNRLTEP